MSIYRWILRYRFRYRCNLPVCVVLSCDAIVRTMTRRKYAMSLPFLTTLMVVAWLLVHVLSPVDKVGAKDERSASDRGADDSDGGDSKDGANSGEDRPETYEQKMFAKYGTAVTLFTTLADKPEKTGLYGHTLKNWSMLKPYIHPILYLTDMQMRWKYIAEDFGWTVRAAPVARGGIPVLRAMYMDAIRVSNSSFYCFANSDIMFDIGYVRTAYGFHELGYHESKNFLAVGRRYNINFTLIAQESVAPENILTFREKMDDMKFVGYAIDYFMTPALGIPWSRIPEFVIGRVRYDNWLVWSLTFCKYTVVDMTGTVLAAHQTTGDGNWAGLAYDDNFINEGLLSKQEHPGVMISGDCDCAPYKTVLDDSDGGWIRIEERTQEQRLKTETCGIYFKPMKPIPPNLLKLCPEVFAGQT